MNDKIAYNLTLWGVTFSFTLDNVMSIAAIMVGAAGVIMQFLNWREKRRENNIREKEITMPKQETHQRRESKDNDKDKKDND